MIIETKEKEPQQTKWGCSSVGRAPALQAGGHGFESHHLQSELEDRLKQMKVPGDNSTAKLKSMRVWNRTLSGGL